MAQASCPECLIISKLLLDRIQFIQTRKSPWNSIMCRGFSLCLKPIKSELIAVDTRQTPDLPPILVGM
jgi:hypothetical protein